MSGKIVFVIGIVFTVMGVSLWVYAGLNILTREQTLSGTDLSAEERWRVEGSLRWWRDLIAHSYPLAAGLSIGGLFAIALSDHFQGKRKPMTIVATPKLLTSFGF